MVKALLGQIQGVFKKDFLFASFLPSLVFLSAVVGSLASEFGFQPVLAWSDAWTTTQKSVIVTVSGVFVVVFAYLLNGLREFLFLHWSGSKTSLIIRPFLQIRTATYLSRYEALQKEVNVPLKWNRIGEWLRNSVNERIPKKPAPTKKIDAKKLEAILKTIDGLKESMTRQDLQTALEPLLEEYQVCEEESLSEGYAKANKLLGEWEKTEGATANLRRFQFDRSFGNKQSVKGNKLGNVVESYNYYSYSRYRLEAEVFWPHLQEVISDSMMAKLQDARMLLDFSISMATLAAMYSILVLIFGLWLTSHYIILGVLTGTAFLTTSLFYGMGVFAAMQFGDLVRACFDLYRLKLMKAFNLTIPPEFSKQRKLSLQISQLLVYGETSDFSTVNPP
jgi:hypothetical protein